jgi:hypothetical protein
VFGLSKNKLGVFEKRLVIFHKIGIFAGISEKIRGIGEWTGYLGKYLGYLKTDWDI